MASLALLRVDNRLIHGQVTAFWIRTLSCDSCVVIDDVSAGDKYMKKIMKLAMASSPSKLYVYSVDEAIEKWNENQFGKGKAMVVFGNITTALAAYEKGLTFKELQVGGVTHKTGYVQVLGPIYLGEDEARMLDKLQNDGVDVTFQVLSEQKAVEWDTIRRKSFPNL